MATTKPRADFGFIADIDLGSTEYELQALIQKGAADFTISGTVLVDGKEFRLSYVDTDTAKVVVGVFETPGGQPLVVDLNSLATAISPEVGDLVPSVEVSISGAMFALAKADNGGPTALVFGVEFGAAIDMAGLPLVGPKLAGGRTAKMDGLKVMASNVDLDKPMLETIRGSLVRTRFQFGDPTATSLPAGPMVAARLQMGDAVRQMTLPLSKPTPRAPTAKTKKTSSSAAGSGGGSASANANQKPKTTAGVTPTNAAGVEKGGGVKWFDLNKTFGPVTVGRVGFQMGDGELTLLVDGGMGFGPVAFGLAGLGVTNPLTAFDPKFRLDGLALAYKSGPIEISGGLLFDRASKSFVGTARIKTPSLTITAMGGYQELNGEASLFLYAVLDFPLGGPAFFFVTGLALGFGYNRGLIIPPAEDIPKFPFVEAAMAGPPSAPVDPIAKMRELQRVVPARQGEMFFAVGIKFTSFKLLDSFVLLIVRLGRELVIDLLGISRVSAPPLAPTPVAQAELAIRATLNLTKGTLLVRGVLTSNSYILSRSCQLTGGFAFAAWFADQPGGAKAGEFVVTLGGYHPDFKVPDYYPRVPRVGLRWQVTRELSIKGGIYMALTPRCIMAGGDFSAVFSRGSIKASFHLAAHFLISWQPYYYRAQMSARFSFKYRIRVDLGWFGTINKTLSFNVSAGLKLWGPEFGGTAKVKVSVVSFTVNFGSKVTAPGPISWSEFETSFLPSASERLAFSITDGVTREIGGVPIVNGADFELALNAVIPIVDNRATGSTKSFGLAPMDTKTVKESNCSIEVSKDGVPFDDLIAEPMLKSGAKALWGSSMGAGLGGEDMIDQLVMGYRFTSKPVRQPSVTNSRPISDFAYDIKVRSQAFSPAAGQNRTEKPPNLASTAANANAKATNGRRIGMLKSLGLDPDRVRLSDLGERPDQGLVAAPQVTA